MPWRVRRFARLLDEALVIFPEVPLARRRRGHVHRAPAADALLRDEAALAAVRDPAITCWPARGAAPGSRPREVRDHMPLFLQAARFWQHRRHLHAAHVAPSSASHRCPRPHAGVPLVARRPHPPSCPPAAARRCSGTATPRPRRWHAARGLPREALVTGWSACWLSRLMGQVNRPAGWSRRRSSRSSARRTRRRCWPRRSRQGRLPAWRAQRAPSRCAPAYRGP
jgi:hypothetical protein